MDISMPISAKVERLLDELKDCKQVVFVSSLELKELILSRHPHLHVKIAEKPQ